MTTDSRRTAVVLACFAANVIAHCDRVNIAVAAPSIMAERGWTTAEMGWVLSAFFAGYTLLMVPAGWAADRWGPRLVLGAAVTWWSVFTALTPLPRSLPGMAAARALIGVGESATAGSINATLVRWIRRPEYARAAGLCWSGGYAGPILAFPVAALIVERWGWRAVFYAFALLGLAWLPVWLTVSRGTPAGDQAANGEAVPWRRLLLSPALWGVWLLHFSSNWTLYLMISWLPTYLVRERAFAPAGLVAGTALPFLCAWLGTIASGWWIDSRGPAIGWASARRRMIAPFALTPVALALIPLAADPTVTTLLLCGAMGALAAATPVFASASLELAPTHAGALAGAQNAFANMAGILAPATTGYAVAIWGWGSAFWVTAALTTVGATAYITLRAPPPPGRRV